MRTDQDAVLSEFVGPFRMSRNDKAKLEALAERNDRTLAAEIRQAVRAHLKKEQKR